MEAMTMFRAHLAASIKGERKVADEIGRGDAHFRMRGLPLDPRQEKVRSSLESSLQHEREVIAKLRTCIDSIGKTHRRSPIPTVSRVARRTPRRAARRVARAAVARAGPSADAPPGPEEPPGRRPAEQGGAS
jgi:hypothetical protein